MTWTIERAGPPVYVWRRTDVTWRTWAYESGVDLGVRGLVDVTLTFTPTARALPSVFFAPNYWPTVELVVDGLIGAQVFTDRKHLAGIVLRRGLVTGVDGLRVEIAAGAT